MTTTEALEEAVHTATNAMASAMAELEYAAGSDDDQARIDGIREALASLKGASDALRTATDERCPRCGQTADDSPDARVDEILAAANGTDQEAER